MTGTPAPDLILHRGLITTLDRSHPLATTVAVTDGRFSAYGEEREIVSLAGPHTRMIDLQELCWHGVRSLVDAMSMLKRQIADTPPQWVRVVGCACWAA